MRYLIIIITAFLLLGCASTKTKKNTETVKEVKEKGTVISKRKADTLNYTILRPIYKDTTITVVNKDNKSTLYVRYNDKGEQNISYVCDEIEELKRYIIDSKEKTNENLKEKESVFKPIFILYIFIGFAFLMFLSRVLKKIGI